MLAGDLNIDSNETPYTLTEKSCLKNMMTAATVKTKEVALEESCSHLDPAKFNEFDQVMRIFQKN